jgi:hypothetical protein
MLGGLHLLASHGTSTCRAAYQDSQSVTTRNMNAHARRVRTHLEDIMALTRPRPPEQEDANRSPCYFFFSFLKRIPAIEPLHVAQRLRHERVGVSL